MSGSRVPAGDVSMFVTVAYDGAPFHGFARQPGRPTVQGAVEDALATVLRREVLTVGAGRTDAGVHALGQVVSFVADASELSDPTSIARSVNGLTPSAISVADARIAPASADARHSALSRAYRYRISAGGPAPVLCAPLVWRLTAGLDVDAMRAGAAFLEGEHDFRSFCVAPSAEGRRTVREIDRIAVLEQEVAGESVISVEVAGRSFLHSMVRIVVGTLVAVGRGRRTPESVAEALEARDRAAAGETAPPQGLVLEAVRYPDDLWFSGR